MPNASSLRATPLNSVHRALGAKMVDFGGWDMPVQYSGIIDEHHTVRSRVGLFDVSHMGEIEIRGPEALQLAEFVTTNQVRRTIPACSTIMAGSWTTSWYIRWPTTTTSSA
jgi:aminomethyltransferase